MSTPTDKKLPSIQTYLGETFKRTSIVRPAPIAIQDVGGGGTADYTALRFTIKPGTASPIHKCMGKRGSKRLDGEKTIINTTPGSGTLSVIVYHQKAFSRIELKHNQSCVVEGGVPHAVYVEVAPHNVNPIEVLVHKKTPAGFADAIWEKNTDELCTNVHVEQ